MRHLGLFCLSLRCTHTVACNPRNSCKSSLSASISAFGAAPAATLITISLVISVIIRTMTTLLIWWSTPLLTLSLLRNRLTKGLVVFRHPAAHSKMLCCFYECTLTKAVSLYSFQSFKWINHELGDPVTQLNLFLKRYEQKDELCVITTLAA